MLSNEQIERLVNVGFVEKICTAGFPYYKHPAGIVVERYHAPRIVNNAINTANKANYKERYQ